MSTDFRIRKHEAHLPEAKTVYYLQFKRGWWPFWRDVTGGYGGDLRTDFASVEEAHEHAHKFHAHHESRPIWVEEFGIGP